MKLLSLSFYDYRLSVDGAATATHIWSWQVVCCDGMRGVKPELEVTRILGRDRIEHFNNAPAWPRLLEAGLEEFTRIHESSVLIGCFLDACLIGSHTGGGKGGAAQRGFSVDSE